MQCLHFAASCFFLIKEALLNRCVSSFQSAIPLRLKESSSVVNVNPSESTHFRVIQNDVLEDLQSSTPLPAVEQADVVLTLEEPELQEGIPEINEPNVDMLGAAAPPLPANEDVKQAMACLAQPTSGKTDSPSRKKGKSCLYDCFWF